MRKVLLLFLCFSLSFGGKSDEFVLKYTDSFGNTRVKVNNYFYYNITNDNFTLSNTDYLYFPRHEKDSIFANAKLSWGKISKFVLEE